MWNHQWRKITAWADWLIVGPRGNMWLGSLGWAKAGGGGGVPMNSSPQCAPADPQRPKRPPATTWTIDANVVGSSPVLRNFCTPQLACNSCAMDPCPKLPTLVYIFPQEGAGKRCSECAYVRAWVVRNSHNESGQIYIYMRSLWGLSPTAFPSTKKKKKKSDESEFRSCVKVEVAVLGFTS